MAIFRGVGGSGDSSDNSFLDAVTAQANAASASATAAANSATSALNTELTSASFNTSDGVLTLTKQDGDTVTADLDGRFLTSYTETDPVFTAHVANGITATNISNWNTAYNNHITAVDYSGSTLTLTQQDGGTLTTTINGALGSTLVHSGSTKIEAISSGVTVTGDITVSGTVDGRDLATDGTKLDGIEANATADQTDAEIKTAYENNADTNAFTDADHTKLDGIEANATADQTGAEIKSAYEAVADTNAFTDAEKTKLSGIEASADVTDTANVTAAGAVMDGDFTSNGFMKRDGAGVYSVDTSTYLTSFDITTQTDPKYLRSDAADTASGFIQFSSGFNTTSGTFTGGISGTTASFTGNVTVDGTVDGRDISADGTKLDNLIKEHTFYDNLSHSQGSNKVLTTSYSIVGTSQRTLSGLGSKHINFSLDLIFYNVSNTNDGELKVGVTCPNPANETTVNLGTVQSVISPTSYFKEWTLTGDVTKHLSQYSGLSKNNSSGGASMGGMFKYRYSPFSDKTIISTSTFMNPPSVGDTIYLHPFDWEAENTAIDGQVFTMDGTTDSTLTVRRDFKQSLGYFTSSVNVNVKAREVSTADNIAIDAMRGSIVQIGN